jgi:hypothetical protein
MSLGLAGRRLALRPDGVATLVANSFWTMLGHERFVATGDFFEHLGLIGGLVLAAVVAARREGHAGQPDLIACNPP